MPCIHTAPSLRKNGDKREKICVGATTSTRMERFTPGLIGQYGGRAIIGKGGLYQDSLEAMKKYGAVYLAIVGRAAALETEQIEEVEQVYFEKLHPEALYRFGVKNFGPLTVAMDSHGTHLYERSAKKSGKSCPASTPDSACCRQKFMPAGPGGYLPNSGMHNGRKHAQPFWRTYGR